MTSIHEQDKKKGERPPTGRVRKLSKSVTVKFSKPSYEALRLRARKANRKLAEYIRESALNGEMVCGHNKYDFCNFINRIKNITINNCKKTLNSSIL